MHTIQLQAAFDISIVMLSNNDRYKQDQSNLTRSARLNFDTTQKERIRKLASMRSV